MAYVRLAVEAAEKWAHRSLEACLRDREGLFLYSRIMSLKMTTLFASVPDPDPSNPRDFGPPGSGSICAEPDLGPASDPEPSINKQKN